jgi:lipid A 3-O-deacylase
MAQSSFPRRQCCSKCLDIKKRLDLKSLSLRGGRKVRIRSKKILLVFFLSLLPLQAYAETRGQGGLIDDHLGFFIKNGVSAQFVAGALFGPVAWVHDHASFSYAQTNLRFGWMATDAMKTKYLGRGNFELLFELTNSTIFKGAGSYLRGFTLLGRYNLFLSNPNWVPYFQIGAGVIANDASSDTSQSEIGQSVEFTPQGSIGLQHFIGANWTLDVEAMYHHISNAGISHGRNGGINSVGGFLGVTYFFGRLRY